MTEAKEMDLFYCRPCPTVPKKPEDPWYISVLVGKNTLSSMVKDMFAEAGIEGKKSNHSLRVAGATSLFAAGVPEWIIQGRTGHSSIEALRKYERVTKNQEVAVSKILTCEKDSFEILPDPVKQMPPVSPSKSVVTSSTASTSLASPVVPPLSGVQYNNCTINVNYSASPNFSTMPGFTPTVQLAHVSYYCPEFCYEVDYICSE